MSLCFEELPGLINCHLHPVDLRGLIGPSLFDTRKLHPGELFWALQGGQVDGHNYVFEAFNRGAQAAVVSEAWFQQRKPSLRHTPCVVVPDTLKALQNLAEAHRRRFQMPVLALTGSNGKTTTKELISAALRSRYKIIRSPGNYNNHIGVPLSLLQIDPETELVVIEMGTNQPGDIEQLCAITQPDHGLVLNVGLSHLQGLRTVAGVAEEKEKLLKSLPVNGVAFINCDDPFVCQMDSGSAKRICFGFDSETPGTRCDHTFTALNLGLNEQGRGRFRLRDVTIEMNWYGIHQVRNGLAAAVVASYFEIPLESIAEIFSAMSPIEGRLNVERMAGFTILNDSYNANPSSTAAALDFLSALNVSGKRYALLGDNLELGEDSAKEHERIGKMISSCQIDGVYLFGEEIQHAAVDNQSRILDRFSSNDDIEKISQKIIKLLRPGDAILIKASRGMELDRVIRYLRKHYNRD
ncbi:UDP-N-acetylmuramoyl-tripeptide--D-alanyl-D-alanine ligase [bacterium]|nr:UDP-N-acetylmuramoyl-tripeptide--D-alanyl-D-alanine ligase [bacterium]MBU1651879.1 UDP-N-acetylmuramoyl-tripeptide--D-alanyl-D-alanine ligase [bacterium]MBU1882183.1 UDP-N-acetylmuramoyl-tripeptide--D-alanyl-D-alanine ligase [bacterium]